MSNKVIVWSRIFKAASIKRIVNCIKVVMALALSTITKKTIVWGVPFVVTIEPTVNCNLHCPQCLTGMGKIKREQKNLSINLFNRILEQIGDKTWYLLLYNQGEPFLNQKLVQFIHLAKQKGIYVTTSTNGHFLTDINFVIQLVKSGLDTIIISLDGADSETYKKYRRDGNFDQVIQGIKNLTEIKQNIHSTTPQIFLQCLVMRHNEHQLDRLKRLARELKVDRLLFKTFQVESKEEGAHFLPDNLTWCRYQQQNGLLKLKYIQPKGCRRLWYSTIILSDGRVVPCCFDKNGTYAIGRIDEIVSFQEIWGSNAYNKFRNQLLQRTEKFDICKNCTQGQKIYFSTDFSLLS